MATEKTILVYSFDELSPQAQERAAGWWREGATDHGWWQFVLSDARAIGDILGFDIPERNGITFSGFWSQGDGAAFTAWYRYSPGWRSKLRAYAPLDAELVAIGERLQAAQRPFFYKLAARFSPSDSRSYWTRSDCVETDTGDAPQAVADEVDDISRDFAAWIYRRLESEYEYLTGDECMRESMKANGYTFDAGGRLV